MTFWPKSSTPTFCSWFLNLNPCYTTTSPEIPTKLSAAVHMVRGTEDMSTVYPVQLWSKLVMQFTGQQCSSVAHTNQTIHSLLVWLCTWDSLTQYRVSPELSFKSHYMFYEQLPVENHAAQKQRTNMATGQYMMSCENFSQQWWCVPFTSEVGTRNQRWRLLRVNGVPVEKSK